MVHSKGAIKIEDRKTAAESSASRLGGLNDETLKHAV